MWSTLLGHTWTGLNFVFKISPDHLKIYMSWPVRMIETIKQPLETLLMTPWKWPIWVILHCKNCTSQNFRTEGGHHFFFTFFGFPSLILTIRSYPENFIASRKCKVTPSINTVESWVVCGVMVTNVVQFFVRYVLACDCENSEELRNMVTWMCHIILKHTLRAIICNYM